MVPSCFIPLIFLAFLCSQDRAHSVSAPDLRIGKDFALFFAVKDYDEWADLRNPIKDANAIAKDLREHYGFTTEVVENPTLQEIVEKLMEYRQKTYVQDAQLLIFFSGHGEFIEATKEGFFVPKNGQLNDLFQSTYLPHSRLERAITTIPCPHILLALDACYSGTFNDDIALGKGRLGERPGETTKSEKQQFIERVLGYKSRLYLTSGGKERTPDGLDHSPFTTQFLTALRDFGGGNQILDFDELKSFMKEATPQPHAGQFEGHEAGGDFLFVLEDGAATTSREMPTRPPVDASPQPKEEVPSNNDAETHQTPRKEPATSHALTLATDPAGNTYKTMVINDKFWLQENLDYDPGYGSWCYNDNSQNCEQFGRLYDWSTAQQACEALGDGWRLPTDEEWAALASHFGGYLIAKEGKTVGQDPKGAYRSLLMPSENSMILQRGGMRLPNRKFNNGGENGYYWTASASTTTSGWAWYYFSSSFNKKIVRNEFSQQYGISCRCVKD